MKGKLEGRKPMIRIRTAAALFLLLLAAASPLRAGVYDRTLCPMYKGEFLLITGQLWLDITGVDGKPVEKRREKIANPLDERSHDALAKRGPVSVEAHPDKKSGDLFIHWGTLKDTK
jgi:hypothetical protein